MTALLWDQSRIGRRLAVGFGEIVAVFNDFLFLRSVEGDLGIEPSYPFCLCLCSCRL